MHRKKTVTIFLFGSLLLFTVFVILLTGHPRDVSWNNIRSVKDAVRSAIRSDPHTNSSKKLEYDQNGEKKDRFQTEKSQHDKGQEEFDRDEIIRIRLADRVERLNSVCLATHDVNTSTYFADGQRGTSNRLQYCMIPKVGTTFVSRISKKLRDTYNGTMKRYVIVREPYSRMVSGYIDKIVCSQVWWKNYGTYIIGNYRRGASWHHRRCGNNVFFTEFILYLIKAQKTGRSNNPHWVPMSKHCEFCKRRYDYVAHLETLKDDLEYIYESANISVKTDFSDERMTISGKCESAIKQRPITKKCEKASVTLKKIWWSFQARGLIANDVALPLNDTQCDTITGKQFTDLAWKAHEESVGRIDRRKQKRNAIVKLFLRVPLRDRIKLRDLYREDFDMFGYDPEPPDLFPELYKTKMKTS